MDRFAGRYGPWALITGASEGIGRELATAVARRGLNVALVARRTSRLQHLSQEIREAHGVQTQILAADLAQPDAVRRLAEQTRDLDVGLLVLAAGFGTSGPLTDSAPDTQLEMIAVNVAAVTALARAFAPRLVARGHGGVVLFGSILGWQGVPGQATYAATKAYVQAFAEGLRAELRPDGVDVLSVAPGPVHTGFAARAGLSMTSADTPDVVAKAALAALGRRTTVVPGTRAKLLTAALASLPRRYRTAILGSVMRRMRSPERAAAAYG
ncbi:SDR family NAD(P)-dependent oxidoreductase [Mycobacterium sp. Marseille-P9652]|uniref:SDR family NAD(P)-dependent oxidoreductase n=1 Tax=Mycobacterium sp. Marseille-P9652 TaxID=2654950 RepID=UPI0012E99221|nr:SDR family oxidoreductase [Mycobacterium sp. Marseille-P9652]